jgi:ATP-dependent Clp protease adaptor protein ClpS
MDTKDTTPNLKEKTVIKKPRKFKVIFFNDDFTPFFFVEKILTIIFNKSEAEAIAIADKIHSENSAVVGVYPLEIAETKRAQTMYNAQQNSFPLHCEVEPDDSED